MSSTRQIESALKPFKETPQKGLKICEVLPARYEHKNFMELLAEARKKGIISGYWAEIINNEGTYYYKV